MSKGVIRVTDKRGVTGWQARVYTSPRRTKYFADSDGGPRAAYNKALKWRRETEGRLGEPQSPRRIRRELTKNGNPPGVYLSSCFGRRGITIAWTDKAGEFHRTWWPIDKFGADTYRRAVEWRAQAEAQTIGGIMPATAKVLKRGGAW